MQGINLVSTYQAIKNIQRNSVRAVFIYYETVREQYPYTLHHVVGPGGSRRMHALMSVSPLLKTFERHFATQVACNRMQLVQ